MCHHEVSILLLREEKSETMKSATKLLLSFGPSVSFHNHHIGNMSNEEILNDINSMKSINMYYVNTMVNVKSNITLVTIILVIIRTKVIMKLIMHIQ